MFHINFGIIFLQIKTTLNLSFQTASPQKNFKLNNLSNHEKLCLHFSLASAPI